MKTKTLWSIRCPHCKYNFTAYSGRAVEIHVYLLNHASVELLCSACHKPYRAEGDGVGPYTLSWDPKAKAEIGSQVSEVYLNKKGAQVVDLTVRLSNPDGSPLSDEYSTSLVTPLRYFPKSVCQGYDMRTGYMFATIQVYAPPSHYVMPGEERETKCRSTK